MLRILTVFGTRPEAIKMAPVVKALAADETIDARLCATAQHRQMLDLFRITPDYDLGLMTPGQDLTDITAKVLHGLRGVLSEFLPDLVMRDTTERPEAVDAGTVRLVGNDEGIIVGSVSELLDAPAAYDAMARAHNPYGAVALPDFRRG